MMNQVDNQYSDSSPDLRLRGSEQVCPVCKRKFTIESFPEVASQTSVFCSARCKMIDLGRWMEGAYRVPLAEQADTET